MPPDEADRQASAAVTPAGQPNRYANEQIASVGGFIGDPTKPGSNRFSTAVQPNGTSSYSPAPVMPPWMVEQAGQANELSGYNPQSVSDLQDAYGGLVQDPTSKDEEIQQAGVAKLRGLVDPNRLEDERKMTVGALRGAAGNVSDDDIESIDAIYKAGIPRFLDGLRAGGDPQQLDNAIFGQARSSAKGLVMEKRYQESSASPSGLSWIEQRQYSDAMTRKRNAEELLGNKKKRMESLVSESYLQNQIAEADDILQRLEAKSGGAAPAIAPAGGGGAPSSSLQEGQRVRNKRTGQMGTVRNGIVVPD